MRDELFHRSGGGSAAHLRELVSLQAELILSQQEQLLQRSAQLSALGQDKALVRAANLTLLCIHTPAVLADGTALCMCVCVCLCVCVVIAAR